MEDNLRFTSFDNLELENQILSRLVACGITVPEDKIPSVRSILHESLGSARKNAYHECIELARQTALNAGFESWPYAHMADLMRNELLQEAR